MNSRGQAALEYLMTYGWALVIIVVVAGILFFIMSSPSAGVTCNSSDPTKIVLKSANIVAGTALATPVNGTVINLQNGTAGNISNLVVTDIADHGLFAFAGEILSTTNVTTGGTPDTALTPVNAGANVYLFPKYTATLAAGGSVIASTYNLSYNDQFGYLKTVTITCQGNAPQ